MQPERTTRNEMKAHFYTLAIRVLLYKEGNQFVAHALELDIPAYGKTEAEAQKELEALINNQLSFAACNGEPENVHFPAPKEFFDRWEKANQAALKGKPVSETPFNLYGKPAVLVYSDEELRKLRSTGKRAFSRSEKLVAA